MTKLALLMLLTTMAWGQDSVTIHWVNPPELERRFKALESISHDCARSVDSLFVARWKEYKAECWNDSTRHENVADVNFPIEIDEHPDSSKVWVFAPSGNDLTMRYMKVPRIYYTHREPTFQGFMEFLDKRRKQ